MVTSTSRIWIDAPRDAVWAQLLQVLAQRGWLAQAAMPGQEGGA